MKHFQLTITLAVTLFVVPIKSADANHSGDITLDGIVDAHDISVLFEHWSTGSNPGTTFAEGDINLPEPSDDIINAADIGVMFGFFDGNQGGGANVPAAPGPAAPGSAAIGTAFAEYDPNTGQIAVSYNGVNSWFVERVGAAIMTGDNATVLPQFSGLPTDNDSRIGESGFPLATATDLNLGHVAQTALPDDGSLRIFWNTGLGSPLQSASVIYLPLTVVPEPTTLALAAFGLASLGLRRRRRA